MRRAILAGLSLLVVLSGGTALLLLDKDRAPLPSEDELRMKGFAVWPEDTVAEGMDACGEAELWRLESVDTALRFARDILKYPEPYVGLTIDDWAPHTIRYFVNTRGPAGNELPMIIDVRKYDRCWFVVNLEPREGGRLLPSIGFRHGDTGTQLVLRMEGPYAEIGYGNWRREVTWQRGGIQPPQVVLDVRELDPEVTGHITALAPFQEVFTGSASPLGSIPKPATTQVRQVGRREVEETPRVCNNWDAYHRPQAAIADLYTFTLNSAVATRGRKVLFQRGEGAEHVRGNRWLLDVDGMELAARIPELKQGCHRILSLHDGRRPLIKSLHAEPERFTFELNWRKGSDAEIWLISASGRGGGNWRYDRINGPLTLRNYDRMPADEPFFVEAVLRKGREVISAERRWYRTR